MKTLNSVQFQDVDRLNQNAMEGNITTLGEAGNGGVQSLPPIVKLNEPITPEEKEEEREGRIFDEPPTNLPPILEENEDAEDTGNYQKNEMVSKKDMSTETDNIKRSDMQTQTPGPKLLELRTGSQTPKPQVQDSGNQTENPFIDFKKCDKCSGLFSGMDALIKHNELFHKTQAKKQTPSAATKAKAVKRKNENEVSDVQKKITKPSLGKKRSFDELMDDEISKSEPKKKLKVKFADQGEETIFDKVTNQKKKKSRTKEDLQTGSGFFSNNFMKNAVYVYKYCS